MSIDQRTLDLQQIANDIERMTNRHISEPVSITFEKPTYRTLEDFSVFQREKFGLTRGDEYFFISRGQALLYVVNVTADSILTAAHELLGLIAKKF